MRFPKHLLIQVFVMCSTGVLINKTTVASNVILPKQYCQKSAFLVYMPQMTYPTIFLFVFHLGERGSQLDRGVCLFL